MSTVETSRQTATIVPDECRLEFLPTLFGRSRLIIGENAVYSFMERLSPLDYCGGFWDFYEYDGKPLFLAPKSSSRFRVTGEIT
ncbi:antirestriction protein, partial [Agrobacterium sp.]|uniref:antirestriction protein n=1 Tax=Agrobacterium sp. TaxID=361 RepID=UPI0028A83065